VPSGPCLCGRSSHGGPPRPRFSLIATPPISPHIMSRSGMEKVNSANFALWGFSEVPHRTGAVQNESCDR
jgi:hypothetical protein